MSTFDLVLTEMEKRALKNLKILLDTRNALSYMGSHCTVLAESQIMSQAGSLIVDMDREIDRQRKEIYEKATHEHFYYFMHLLMEALPEIKEAPKKG